MKNLKTSLLASRYLKPLVETLKHYPLLVLIIIVATVYVGIQYGVSMYHVLELNIEYVNHFFDLDISAINIAHVFDFYIITTESLDVYHRTSSTIVKSIKKTPKWNLILYCILVVGNICFCVNVEVVPCILVIVHEIILEKAFHAMSKEIKSGFTKSIEMYEIVIDFFKR